jgi:hypothetical protein
MLVDDVAEAVIGGGSWRRAGSERVVVVGCSVAVAVMGLCELVEMPFAAVSIMIG